MHTRIGPQHFAYWIGSFLINAIIFTGFASLFLLSQFDLPERKPLKIVIKEVTIKSPPPPKPAVKEEKKSEKKSQKVKTPSPAVENVHERGDVPVKVNKKKEEDVKILASIEELVKRKIEEKGTKRNREFHKENMGTISAVVSGKGITFMTGNRKIVHTPPLPSLVVSEFPAPLRIKIWVNPYGRVIKAVIVQRSGDAKIDSILLRYIKSVRFESINADIVQTGEITFRFRGG